MKLPFIKWRKAATDKAGIVCSPLQYYPGYETEDLEMLKQFADVDAVLADDYYIDGFGVKTRYDCVPFEKRETLTRERLQFPVPDDGFHAEAIEYVALIDAFQRFSGQGEFCAVEVGAAWGPWIGLAGVLAKKQGLQTVRLVGVEASPDRFGLMRRHFALNELRPEQALEESAQLGGVETRLFNGAIWTHDGEIWFPDSDVVDMGAAAAAECQASDYRGMQLAQKAVPCRRLDTLLVGIDSVDFMHVDIQGAEWQVVASQIDWLGRHVKALMLATHSRVIEGRLMDLLFEQGWQLQREKPCRVDWHSPQGELVGKTLADGSQYWLNKRFA